MVGAIYKAQWKPKLSAEKKLLNPKKMLRFGQFGATPAFILLDYIGHLVNQPILGGQINRREELSYKQLAN